MACRIEAERKACNIRIRAERQAGKLLKLLAKATPQTARQSAAAVAGDTEYAAALERRRWP